MNEHNITPYEISQNTSLSEVGIQKIKNGKSENPRTRTLDEIESYLNKKIGLNISDDILIKRPTGNSFNHDNSPFFTTYYDKEGNRVSMEALADYSAKNIEKLKGFLVFKNAIDIEALKLILKAKEGDQVNLNLLFDQLK